jgi:hypothetical protein
MWHKGTPRDRATISSKLQPIVDRGASVAVKLVFDGTKGRKKTVVSRTGTLETIKLAEGLSADDYIVDSITDFLNQHHPRKSHQVQVVTADRALRRRVRQKKPLVRGAVNPSTFWRRYLPRLSGYKLPKDPVEEENK